MEGESTYMLSQEDPSNETKVCVEVEEAWQQSAEARGYMNALLKRNKRKTFGLLEKPLLDPHYKHLPVLFKRLFLVGKAGVGKTSTVDKLCGRDITPHHVETLGIQTNTVYWPAKLSQPRKKVILVHLELWDTGDRAMGKFGHIRPACKQATDGTIYFFSYTDRHSWEELPHLISSQTSHDSELRLVVGTHADSYTRDVTEAEVEQFQQATNLIVLPIANVNGPRMANDASSPDGREGIKDITPFMNTLTQVLLAHVQVQRLSTLDSTMDNFLATLSPDTESPSQ